MQNENERGANSHQLAGRGAYFLAPDVLEDRHGMSTCFSATLHFENSKRVAMKHYLQVTDRQFSEAAGVAQGMAPAQVIGNQGISENSPTVKNKAFPLIAHLTAYS